MKGIFVQQPFEYRLEVKGDEFFPGDTLPCILTVKNHGSVPATPEAMFLRIADGDLKKVREKADDAFEVISAAEVPAFPSLAAGEQHSSEATFALDRNAAISDKDQSIFLLFGSESMPGAQGNLLVTVKTHPYIRTIVELLESSFQFAPKAQKSSKGWLETKFKASTARRFSFVEELGLACRFEEEVLRLRYTFKVKGFATDASTKGVKKGKTEVDQRLEPSSYLLAQSTLHHENVERSLAEALGSVASGL